jgi:uncharacterized protein
MKPLLLALALLSAPVLAAMQQAQPAPVQDVWKPAATPKGGVSWATLESTKEIQRTDKAGIIFSKPAFPASVKALDGKKVRVAGWMMPLGNGEKQAHFVLLGYPPGCPFHLHAGPTQFVEVKAAGGVPMGYDMIVVEGTLQLMGQDESGIFYRLNGARAVG